MGAKRLVGEEISLGSFLPVKLILQAVEQLWMNVPLKRGKEGEKKTRRVSGFMFIKKRTLYLKQFLETAQLYCQ